jgi:hypothetical protein
MLAVPPGMQVLSAVWAAGFLCHVDLRASSAPAGPLRTRTRDPACRSARDDPVLSTTGCVELFSRYPLFFWDMKVHVSS